jgi:hypothetical protein
MAEIRCPMCGKENPAELDVCQFCEARLKPLTAPLSPDDVPASRGADDWLGSLRGEDEDGDAWGEGDEDSLIDDFDLGDPLDRLGGLDAERTDSEAGSEEPAEALAPEQPLETASDDVDLAAWLAGLDAEDGDAAPAPAKAEPELPDWLSQFGEPAGATEPEAAEVGDTAETEEPPGEATEQELDNGEELPDWLLDIGEEQQAGEEAEPEPEIELTPAEDLPEWLTELEGSEVVIEDTEEAQEEISATETAEEMPAAELGGPEQPDGDQDELPGWLAEIESVTDEVAGGIADEAVTAPVSEEFEEALITGDIPDWLAELEPAGDEEAGDLGEAGEEEPGDEWLSELTSDMTLDEGKRGLESEDEAAQPVLFTQDDELDEELRGMYLAEEPDWLSDVTGETEGAGEAGDEQAVELAHAELPGWLEAMRPVDAVVSPEASFEEEEGEFESTGPLAGLRDVLPAEASIAAIRKPEALSVKLDVTESQKKHIKLLDDLLRAEEEPHGLEKASPITSQGVLRILIGLILFVTTFLMIRTGSQGTGLPLPAPEVRDANRLLSGLSAQSPVLLVFDYEPGLAGEMDVLARAVVDHLMLGGADLTLVSTTPSGPLLAERTIVYLGTRHTYVRGEQYVNLGFLPGGPAGVQSLVHFPLRLTLPYALGEVDNYDPWSTRQRPLSRVAELTDYTAVVIITDRQEAARAWIEQAGPALAETPLILATSAQLEPLVRPYYESTPRLVDGFLSGLAGSASYERQLGIPGQARLYWDTYSMVVMVSAAVIALGALLNLLAGAMSKSQPTKGKPSDEPA